MCAVAEKIPKITVDLLVLFRESGISIKKKKGYNSFIGLDTITNMHLIRDLGTKIYLSQDNQNLQA